MTGDRRAHVRADDESLDQEQDATAAETPGAAKETECDLAATTDARRERTKEIPPVGDEPSIGDRSRKRRAAWLVLLVAAAAAGAFFLFPRPSPTGPPTGVAAAPEAEPARLARVLLDADGGPGITAPEVDPADPSELGEDVVAGVEADDEMVEGGPDAATAPPTRRQARSAGVLGALASQPGAHTAPTSPFGTYSTVGHGAGPALGALMGTGVGSNFGFGGLGLHGTGRGGGGVGSVGIGASAIQGFDREAYEHIDEVGPRLVADHPLSTFSVDVDTASYANVRRFLNDGALPPPDAVRIEEMINYFDYDYAPPADGAGPFAVHTEVGPCPWNSDHRLLHVGIQGRRIDQANVPPRNLVFLLDVSGSMEQPDKLPLLLSAMNLLVDNLRRSDRVAIVVYAGAAGLVLPSTRGTDRAKVRDALARLRAGGATAGGQGIELAYRVARQNYIDGGVNRVVLATDGDFNVGPTSHGALTRLIAEKRRSGVFLSVLGFGTGNLGDHTMETLADRGNGNYAYIDSIAEARRVLVRTAGGTLVTIAKDVKLQLEFNPARVASYRLIGYDNRRLRDEEFNDDARDAGELGAGHTVTALYEFTPASSNAAAPLAPPSVDPLRYQGERSLSADAGGDEIATVKIRYKRPDEETSILLSRRVREHPGQSGRPSSTFRFSAAVAAFGMVLRDSDHRGAASLTSVRALASAVAGPDPHGDRRDFLRLVALAEALSPSPPE